MPSNIQNVVATFNNYFKKILFPSVRTIYRTSTPTLALFQTSGSIKARDDMNGMSGSHVMRMDNNSFYIDVQASPIFAAFTGENAQVIAGTPNIAQFQINGVSLFNSVQFSEQSLLATASRIGGVESASKTFSQLLTDGAKRTLGRAILAASSGGVIAVTTGTGSASNSMTVQLDSDRGGTSYITPNMIISVAGATGGTSIPGNASATTVLTATYGSGTQTITLADSLTWSSAANITMASPDGSGVTEMTSLGSLIASSGTVQGVNIANYPNMQSHTYSTSGSFSAGEAMTLYEQCQTGKPKKWICDQLVYAACRNSQLSAERTGMGQSALLDIGYSSLTAMGEQVEIILDYDCPYGTLYGLYMDGYTLGILEDLHYVGIEPLEKVPKYPIYETMMGWYGNLAQSAFEPNFKYTNITA